MGLSPRLEVAMQSFNLNSSFLKQGVAGLTDDDWLKRPREESNHLLWIVGHMTWSRSMVLARLGDKWTLPWMPLYARGRKCVDCPDSPSPKAVMEAWDESCGRLSQAMESATEELLDTPAAKPGPPSADGKLSGTINFMALHETYHVGQCAYIRSLLGKPSVMG
jgi:uncharacterized damage-inducible protein DinB